MGLKRWDIREYYTAADLRRARKELAGDAAFQHELKRRGTSVDALLTTTYPLKYLGIELGQKGSRRTRFSLATALRIALRPRSMDGASEGLRMSNHRRAFVERFPDVDAALSTRVLFDLGPGTDVSSVQVFVASEYAAAAAPALDVLSDEIGVPVSIALRVLRKGLAAYRRGHRPGMSAHGWARARLTSFVMKGCTHFFPDHELVNECPQRTHDFWDRLPCLCRKRAQCDKPGRRTRANAKHTPG